MPFDPRAGLRALWAARFEIAKCTMVDAVLARGPCLPRGQRWRDQVAELVKHDVSYDVLGDEFLIEHRMYGDDTILNPRGTQADLAARATLPAPPAAPLNGRRARAELGEESMNGGGGAGEIVDISRCSAGRPSLRFAGTTDVLSQRKFAEVFAQPGGEVPVMECGYNGVDQLFGHEQERPVQAELHAMRAGAARAQRDTDFSVRMDHHLVEGPASGVAGLGYDAKCDVFCGTA